jgi:hypothetical protein
MKKSQLRQIIKEELKAQLLGEGKSKINIKHGGIINFTIHNNEDAFVFIPDSKGSTDLEGTSDTDILESLKDYTEKKLRIPIRVSGNYKGAGYAVYVNMDLLVKKL